MINEQQVDKHHNLLNKSLTRTFSDLNCEQNTHIS